ncbi:MAG: DUF433 domain-containing protein [Candidatus Binatia bacterium]
MNTGEYVVADPEVMLGKPAILGIRITVELILQALAAGASVEQILEAHPRQSREAVSAARAFAAESMKTAVVQPLRTGVTLRRLRPGPRCPSR